MRKIVVGVMGPGDGATALDLQNAYELGELIAQAGWVLLTGGRNVGVMDAASRGAKQAGGLTIGILPGSDRAGLSEAVDIAILTDLGNARNNINVLSSDIVVACGMGLGTLSEIALALKSHRVVVLLNPGQESWALFQNLSSKALFLSQHPTDAIKIIEDVVTTN